MSVGPLDLVTDRLVHFLWQLSQMKLQLVSTHTDSADGIEVLSALIKLFNRIFSALSAVSSFRSGHFVSIRSFGRYPDGTVEEVCSVQDVQPRHFGRLSLRPILPLLPFEVLFMDLLFKIRGARLWESFPREYL